MGENATDRTQRELVELRAAIERDVDAVVARARDDAKPANLVRRQPAAVFGTLGSLGLLAGVAVAKKVRERRARKPDSEIELLITRLGGNIEKLRGRARKRLREAIRNEISEVEKPKRSVQEALWGAGMAGLTAGATALARGFARRITGDETPGRAAPAAEAPLAGRDPTIG